jgi:hypothetical protein
VGGAGPGSPHPGHLRSSPGARVQQGFMNLVVAGLAARRPHVWRLPGGGGDEARGSDAILSQTGGAERRDGQALLHGRLVKFACGSRGGSDSDVAGATCGRSRARPGDRGLSGGDTLLAPADVGVWRGDAALNGCSARCSRAAVLRHDRFCAVGTVSLASRGVTAVCRLRGSSDALGRGDPGIACKAIVDTAVQPRGRSNVMCDYRMPAWT